MARSVIQDQEIKAVSIVGREVIDEDLKAVGIKAREVQKEARTGGRLDGPVQVVALEAILDGTYGFDPAQGETAAADRHEPNATLILAEDPDGGLCS